MYTYTYTYMYQIYYICVVDDHLIVRLTIYAHSQPASVCELDPQQMFVFELQYCTTARKL